MHAWLKWGLAVTCLLSVVALLPRTSEHPQGAVVAAVERPEPERLVMTPVVSGQLPRSNLPAVLPAQVFEAADRDVFAPVERPVPPNLKQLPPQPQSFTPPVAPPPMAPPLRYRFFGRMTTPDGQSLVLLARGELVVQIAVGTLLEDGFRVDALQDDRIQLSFPPLGVVVELPIPPVLGP